MKENIVQKLTSKDDKYACAFTDRIVAESHDTDEWYEYFEDVASLLDHPKSLVRNRALYILAANAQWDEENRFDLILPDYLKHITDEKPITARQCVKALAQVGLARPQYIPQILSALRSADLSKYKDSMRPLIERDIEETEKILINSSLQVRKMKYRLPEINDKDILQKYVQEHHNNGETSISASLGLSSSDYTEWVTKIKNNALSGDEQWGKSLLYLCFDGDRLIGLLSVRYELPEVLSEKYGDIGYGVRPSERNKGYATAMLKYALSVCKEKGMEKVILGCYKENLASAATIQKNGGTLIAENENYKEGRTSQYYLIRL